MYKLVEGKEAEVYVQRKRYAIIGDIHLSKLKTKKMLYT